MGCASLAFDFVRSGCVSVKNVNGRNGRNGRNGKSQNDHESSAQKYVKNKKKWLFFLQFNDVFVSVSVLCGVVLHLTYYLLVLNGIKYMLTI